MKHSLLKVIRFMIAIAVLTAGFLFLALTPALSAILPDNMEQNLSDPNFIEDQKLKRLVEGLMDEYGLNRDNLCLVIKNLQDQREYTLNETQAFFAASVYKLPLAMLYYEDYLNQMSSIELEDSRYGVLDYETIHQDIEAAVVDSNNEAAKELFHNLGGWSRFVSLRERYRTDWIHPAVLAKESEANYIDGAYLKAVLEDLYINREDFSELLFYLSRAQPESYLNGLVPELYVQKYGAYEQCLNIVGLNLKHIPYLVIVLSDGQQGMESFMANLGQKLDLYFNSKQTLQEKQTQSQTNPFLEKEQKTQAFEWDPPQESQVETSYFADTDLMAQEQTEAAFEPALPSESDPEPEKFLQEQDCLAASE